MAFGIAAAVIIPALLILFKAIAFRGDLHQKWSQRIDLCSAGLAELADRRIKILRSESIRIVGDPNEQFDPAYVVSEPVRLMAYVTDFQRAIKTRQKLHRWHKTNLRYASFAPYATSIYIFGAVLLTLYYTGLTGLTIIKILGFSLVVASLIGGAVVSGVHFYCDRRLVTAEMIADEVGSL